jgi:hypothetical protein
MTMSLRPVGTDSLQLPPAKHVPVTTTDASSSDGTAATAPMPAAQPGTLGRPLASPAAPHAAGPGQQAAAPAPDPSQPEEGSIDVMAERSARVQVRLTKTTHPDFFETAFDRSGRYAGLWVLDSHGAVVGAALELAGAKGKPAQRFTDHAPFLPAGTYTVYVVGDGPTGAHVPLQPGEKGLTATASRAVSATYTTKSKTMGPAEAAGSLRMGMPATSAVGFAGGFIDNPGGAASTVTVCLPRRDAECTSRDPESDGTQVIVGGSVGSVFDVTPKLLRDRRDVLLDAEVHGTTPTELVCWSFTVALS